MKDFSFVRFQFGEARGKVKREKSMKLKLRFFWFVTFLAMATVPAVAQFEVSPDHFDEDSSNRRTLADVRPQDALKQQIAEQKALLASYQEQIQRKTAVVNRTGHDVGTSANGANGAAARENFLRQQRELRDLRQVLAKPIHDASVALAGLERKQHALRPVAQARRVSPGVASTLASAK